MMHGSRLPPTVDAIERAADDVLLPLTGNTLRSAMTLPAPVTGVELSGVGLAFSALKESEDGKWLVLRCVNLTETDVEGSWTVPFEAVEARLARLDETIISELQVGQRRVAFRGTARAIVTVLVR